MAFKAKFDGKCVECGGVVLGRMKHGDNAMEISWNRRSATPGQVKHNNPSCSEVAAGILQPVAGRTAETAPAPVTAPVAVSTAPDIAAIMAALKAAGVPVPSMPVAPVVVIPAATLAPKAAVATSKRITSSAKWWEVLKALLVSSAKRILLVGPPGTGKSTTAQLVDGAKTYRLTMTEGTGIEDLLGMYQLTNDGTGAKTVFVDGPATKALREGARLQIDEITHTPAEIESLLYALMDDDPQITLPTGEHLNAAPGYTVIATTNDNAAQLEQALMDRCESILLAVTPHPDSLGCCSPAATAVVLNYYRSVNTDPWKFNRVPSVRPVRAFEKLRASGLLSDEVLAESIFGTSSREFLSALSTASLKGGK